MIASIAAAALAIHIGTVAVKDTPPQVQAVQYRVPVKPPPCGHGWDVSARDGMCYPNGYLPPQEQAARQYYYRGGGGYGRHTVPCGHGADLDIRDGQCYRLVRYRHSFSRADRGTTATTNMNAAQDAVIID